MTILIKNERIVNKQSQGAHVLIDDYDIQNCRFYLCTLTTIEDPATRAIVSNVHIRDTIFETGSLKGVIVKDCTGDNLVWKQEFVLDGCAFEHVRLSGFIGRLRIRRGLFSIPPDISDAFDQANAEFYTHVDWALDITNLYTFMLQIDDIPGHLIRRDPKRHILFTRDTVSKSTWRDIDMTGTANGLPVFLQDLVESKQHSRVFIIPDKGPGIERTFDVIHQLRDAGIAELD